MQTRKIGIFIAAGLLAAAAGTAAAQQAAQETYKVGYVNTERVMRESKEAQKMSKALEAEFKKRQQEIVGGPKDVFEKRMNALSEDMNVRRQEAQREFILKAGAVIKRIGQQENFDAVFLEVAYAATRADLTDKVIQALDAGR